MNFIIIKVCISKLTDYCHVCQDHKSVCDVTMIEQALAIARSDGGTAQAMLQIPCSFTQVRVSACLVFHSDIYPVASPRYESLLVLCFIVTYTL